MPYVPPKDAPTHPGQITNTWKLLLFQSQPQWRSVYAPKKGDWRWALIRPDDEEAEQRFEETGQIINVADFPFLSGEAWAGLIYDEKKKEGVLAQLAEYKPYPRQWVDETYPANVPGKLRWGRRSSSPALRAYTWFPDAVPVDSLLPPGVPMSGAELLVSFCPNLQILHIRKYA
jgi:hypothetical protein